MYDDRKVYAKFMNRVKLVKDKRDLENKQRVYKKKLRVEFKA